MEMRLVHSIGLLRLAAAFVPLQAPRGVVSFELDDVLYEASAVRDGVRGELQPWLASRLSAAPPDASWLLWKPGLVPLLNHAVRACCAYGADDAVVVATPIYPPFLSAVSNNGARLVRLPLAEARDGGGGAGSLRYEIDWAATEAALRAPQTKLLLWCNPHNPTGRCWTPAELAHVARLCVAHGVLLCSDEVWGEVPLDPDATPFTSMLALLAAAVRMRRRQYYRKLESEPTVIEMKEISETTPALGRLPDESKSPR